MTSESNHWTKPELHIYILLLCANADSDMSADELELIKSKTDEETFNKMYDEFKQDSEAESLDKISYEIEFFDYSYTELSGLKREMQEIFAADDRFTMMEKNLERILDNIIY